MSWCGLCTHFSFSPSLPFSHIVRSLHKQSWRDHIWPMIFQLVSLEPNSHWMPFFKYHYNFAFLLGNPPPPQHHHNRHDVQEHQRFPPPASKLLSTPTLLFIIFMGLCLLMLLHIRGQQSVSCSHVTLPIETVYKDVFWDFEEKALIS